MKQSMAMVWGAFVVLALASLGCADGGRTPSGGDRDAGVAPRDSGAARDAAVGNDAGGGGGTDAGMMSMTDAGRDAGSLPRLDSGTLPRLDAGPPLPGFDAGMMMGPFCTTNADCAGMPGTCCVGPPAIEMGICAPGMVMFGVCFPSG